MVQDVFDVQPIKKSLFPPSYSILGQKRLPLFCRAWISDGGHIAQRGEIPLFFCRQ